MNTAKQRNINIDLIKCLAVLSVICVHFFYNTEFYSIVINNSSMYVMTVFRTAFMVCVPLFITTTGFLMVNKELNLKYYKGIIKTLSIYLLTSVLCLIYRRFHNNELITFNSALTEILSYKAIPYSWYIEMYIGLFVIIPFLNLIYNNLKSDKQRYALIITLICLSSLPSLLNYSQKIISSFWTGIYPLTYYFIGAHIRKSERKHSNKWRYLILFILIILINSLMNINISYNQKFIGNALNDWGGLQNTLSSMCLFIFLSRINLEKTPKCVSFCITKISEYSLGIYLCSYIMDRIIYTKFNALGYTMSEKFKYFVIVVGCVFLGSLLLSAIVNFIYKIIRKLCCIIVHN